MVCSWWLDEGVLKFSLQVCELMVVGRSPFRRGCGVYEQLLSLRKLVDGHDNENGVAADEGVAMLEVREDGRDERLDDLRLIEAVEEAEGDAADVLVRVLEVVAEVLADPGELCLKRVNEENKTWEQNVGGAA
ncbi:hypothetical protein DEO72_LG1g994 [Vigna unguiculata]|uniref:Uncharacterized protein n=1 Tax=Vigna unguiculata TaxID=3917 RepID=A0A4D6KRX0_VIGUN|nr:hypothetical protein DEO72_LG1g994 [Vigna unguiculata]